MADRKVLSSDFASLKARVKAEMQRRCQSGSVSAYGGSAYDFSTPPTDGGPLLGEHLKKNLDPMKAVNPDGLPTYPGTLNKAGMEAMETKVTAWAARSITDRSSSDCKSGCTGTCYTGCTSGCHGCSGDCSGTCSGGCSGCSGCGNSCSTGCGTNCNRVCAANCTGISSAYQPY